MKDCGYKPAVLSTRLARYWHTRLNRELFDNRLRRCDLSVGVSPYSYGPVYGYYSNLRIHLDRRIRTKAEFLNTLAHEMVHQYQHELGVPLTHGKLFKAQAKRLAKHGLTI